MKVFLFDVCTLLLFTRSAINQHFQVNPLCTTCPLTNFLTDFFFFLHFLHLCEILVSNEILYIFPLPTRSINIIHHVLKIKDSSKFTFFNNIYCFLPKSMSDTYWLYSCVYTAHSTEYFCQLRIPCNNDLLSLKCEQCMVLRILTKSWDIKCVCVWRNIHYVGCYKLLLYTTNMKTDITVHSTSDCLKVKEVWSTYLSHPICMIPNVLY